MQMHYNARDIKLVDMGKKKYENLMIDRIVTVYKKFFFYVFEILTPRLNGEFCLLI